MGQLYTTDAGDRIFNLVSILPSFALFRSLYYMGAFNTGGQGVTLSPTNYGFNGLGMCSPGPLCISFGYLAAQWFILLLLGLYFDRVLPARSGIRDHPLFFLGYKRDGTFFGSRSKTAAMESRENRNQENSSDDEPLDVAAERTKAATVGKESGIGIVNLRKEFQTADETKVAVSNLSLAVPQGEVFGLLGHNGAGKTTTISILTGILEITSGDAFLNGLSVRTDMREIYKQTGVCPQFDRLWEDLSGREHLSFYARVKAVKPKDVKGEVEKALESVGLTAAGARSVKTYSGGMKRRLSVAVSLIGEPSFVFLDEPTTGLDPKSKHSLWDCLRERRAGKTIILTTHSMEEAERLCDRVGIMAEGRLRCVGPAEEIKLRLGRGYRLIVTLPERNASLLEEEVKKVSSEATIEASLAGSIVFQLPRSIILSDIFVAIEECTERLGIKDWGISQSSLEDVFIELTQQEHQKVANAKRVESEAPSGDNKV